MTASTIAGTITFHGRANVGDDVVRALFVVRSVGQPGRRPSAKPRTAPDGADDDAVDLQDEPDVAVGRPHRLEHPEGAHAALGQHREAADRHQGDQEHADGRQRQHDGRRVDAVARCSSPAW